MTVRPRGLFQHDLREVDVLASALFSFVAGAVVLPPMEELLYWRVLVDTGDQVLLLVFVASVLLGTGFTVVTDVRLPAFALGGVIAYLVGMAIIEILAAPESPVYLLLYGGVLVGFCVGVAGVPTGRR